MTRELLRLQERARKMHRVLTTRYPVGPTPRKVVWTLNKARLYRYVPKVPPEKRHKEPLLLVYALMNRAYILDLRRGNSFIDFMLREGYDIYLIDWGNPGLEDKELKLDDYVLDYLPRIIRKMKEVSGSDTFSMLGWCIGALLAACYAALRPDEGLNNLVLLTPPLDFGDKSAGSLMSWVNSETFDVDRLLTYFGNMPGELLGYGAKALKPLDSYVTTYIHLWENIDDQRAVDSWHSMNTWINDNVDMAGAFFRQLVQDLYMDNSLAEGRLEVQGEQVDVARIKANILMVLAESDHIVPSCQSDAIFPRLGGRDKEMLRLKGGHIGLMTGRSAVHNTWPRIAGWLGAHSP